jgi:hypothetical protein
LGKGRKNPKIAAYMFFGLGLIALIIGFKFKDWGMDISREMNAMEGAEEAVKKGELIIFVFAILFLILGGYYLYNSTAKKG